MIPLEPPTACGAAAFEQGGIERHGARRAARAHAVRDDFAHASGLCCWDLDLAPGAARELELAVPFGERADAAPYAALESVERAWEQRLGKVRIRAGGGAEWADALRTAAAHILVNRNGAWLQPGPRRYTRSWIRDGATMAAALLRMGEHAAVREFLRAYAPYQAADGNVPCAVDASGADWLPEHDSHGQLAFTLAEYFRFSGDRELARELWPNVLRATEYLERLRAQRRGPEFQTGALRARYGLLPESASHEGYLAHPVHAYWDDFWALRGLGDAAELAQALGEAPHAERLRAQQGDLRECLYASIATTIAERKLAYVPGSVEWADFDPAATATALTTTDAAERLPQAELAASYDEYLAGFRRRRDGEIPWNNYTAYEIRIVGALVRLGRRADAHELLDFFLADRRPRAVEPVARDLLARSAQPGSPGRRAAQLDRRRVRAGRAGHARLRSAGRRLAGAGGRRLRGVARGRRRRSGRAPHLVGPARLSAAARGAGRAALRAGPGPPHATGGIVLRPPLARPLVGVEGDGVSSFDSHSATLQRGPASVRLAF